MSVSGKGKLVLAIMGATFLSACEEGQSIKLFDKPLFQGNQEDGDAATAESGTVTTIEKDVEAPDVFQETENGLWDGRPSLGGVWVAHPNVVDPERAIIRNQANGKFIIGALFRRERDNPGPRFQVSSDAAAELGMLAGSPAELNVTVLRREEIVVAPPVAAPTVDTLETTDPIEETTLDQPVTEEPVVVDPVAIDPVAKIAASAIEAATASSGASTSEGAPEPAPVSAPASTLTKPFVQIGIFSVESNAQETADRLRGSGVVPTIKTFTSSGKKYWRVIIGPAPSAAARSALIAKAKELGFADSYAVTN